MKHTHALALQILIVPGFTISTWAGEGEGVEGIWQGVLRYPGVELRIAFKVSRMPDGTLRATMLRPDEDDREIPACKVVLEDGQLHVAVPSVSASFDGRVRRWGGVIDGRWEQGRWSQPLVLVRVSEVHKSPRPQTPVPPYPYHEEDVVFANSQAQIQLAGTLTLPRQGRPCPGVLLISGGGAQDRDCLILRHRPFLVMADYLTRRGIAVLRVDDRGVGGSSGDRSRATPEDFAQDAQAGFEYLKARPGIDRRRVGLIGHSEGGIVAPMVATQSPDVAFVVMMGAPGLPGEEYNYQFEASLGRVLGQSEETIAAKRAFQERVFAVLKQEREPAVAKAKLRRILKELEPPISPAHMEAALKRYLSPWFRFSVTYDPARTLRQMRCPVLAIFAEKDVHVPPEGNLQAVEQALKSGGNKDHRVETLPNLNHFFQTARTGAPSEYGEIEETIAPVALELIGDWIRERTE